MNSNGSSFTGYSPNVSMELTIHGERFNVASLGPSKFIVRNPRLVKPGAGTLRLLVDTRVTIYHMELIDGIDPKRGSQPYRLLSTIEEAAA
jgi:hypothetical protein